MSRRLSMVVLAALAGVASTPSSSAAPSKRRLAPERAECARAYESGQELRAKGALIAARGALLTCAQDVCPRVIEKDCIRWLAELEESLPTIVLEVRDAAGRELTELRVDLDGITLDDPLDGKSRPVDPGPHKLRFFPPGHPPVEVAFVAKEGEKNRKVTASVGLTRAEGEGPGGEEPPGEPEAVTTRPGPRPAAPGLVTWLSLGTGAVALGGFAYFGFAARSSRDELLGDCAPECEPEDVSAGRTQAIVADVSLLIGVVALAVAGWSLVADEVAGEESSP